MLLLGRFSVLIQGRVLVFVCLFVFALFVSQGLLILSSNFGLFWKHWFLYNSESYPDAD